MLAGGIVGRDERPRRLPTEDRSSEPVTLIDDTGRVRSMSVVTRSGG